jgi:hypothetical protein
MKGSWRRFIHLVLYLLFLSGADRGLAQVQIGAIRGVVSDQSGAIVPQAEVEATNLKTNLKTSTTSTEAGVYLLNVPVGEYQVVTRKSGFKEAVNQQVFVAVGTTTTLNFGLEVGEVSEQVNVQELVAPLLIKDSADVGTVVDRSLVMDLPLSLNSGFRNPENFITLTPGVTSDGFSKNFNGSSSMASQIVVEGLPVALPDVPGISHGTGSGLGPATPPIEAYEEFKVQTTLFPAEQGRAFGLTNYTLKSGTNNFHGNAWEFLRNDALEARGFFNTTKPIIRQHEFGGTVGGPIIKDKTFFFGAISSFRLRGGSPVRGTVTIPTQDFRRGDFSQLKNSSTGELIPIFDPATTRPDGAGGFVRDPFPGNIIPPDRIVPISRRVMELLPNPDFPGIVNNFTNRTSSLTDNDLFSVKIDHLINQRHKVYGNIWRVFRSETKQTFELGDNPLDRNFPSGAPITGWRASWDWTMSPTLLNHLSYGYYGMNGLGRRPDPRRGNELIQFPGAPPDAPGMARMNIDGYAPMGNSDEQPEQRWSQGWTLVENVSWTRGRHQFKFGGEHWIQRYPTISQLSSGGLSGTYNFSNLLTSQPNSPNSGAWGSSLASFLLGQVQSASKFGGSQKRVLEQYYLAFFVSDKIQLTPKLTLDVGLRYDIPWAYRDNKRFSGIDLNLPNPAAGNRPGAYVFGADKLTPPIDWSEWGPRVGLAYSLNDKTVIRAGYGILYAQTNATALGGYQFGNAFEAGFSGSGVSTQSLDNGVTPAFQFNDGFPALPLPGDNLVPTINIGGNADYLSPSGGQQGQTHNFTLSVQRELPWRIGLDLSYIGNKGTRLPSSLENLNQVPVSYLSLGPLLTQPFNSPEAIAAGITAPFPGFSGSVAQALRPFPQYTNIYNAAQPIGHMTYHSMQMKLQKRFSSGFSFLVTYTLSKAITDTAQDAYSAFSAAGRDNARRQLEKSLAPQDLPHNLVASWVYELPGKNLQGAAGAILKGWSVSGINQYISGSALSIGGGPALPIFNGGNRPNRVPGVSARSGVSTGDFDPSRDLYLNINAFSQPAPFTIGNGARREPNLRGFPLLNENFSLIKRTYLNSVREGFNLEVRADFFNTFNRVRFSNPSANINTPASFGRVGGQANQPRIIQLGFKVNF